MKVLVTGASGLVGGAIARHLIQAGHDVTCLVNNQNVELRCDYVTGRLGDASLVQKVLSNSPRCDAIIHAAAKISYDNTHPEIITTNIIGTEQLIQLARNWQSKTFIFLSSIGVIGKPVQHPITEDHPVNPLSLYHASKLFGEHLVLLQSDIPSRVILRLTAPVGVHMPQQRILPAFVKNAIQHLPLQIQGSGERQQNYVDVRDIAQCVCNALSYTGTGIFNLGGSECISNLNLARLCIELLNSKSTIEHSSTADPAPDEVWNVTIDRAKKQLNYQPQFDIRSVIRQLADYYAQ